MPQNEMLLFCGRNRIRYGYARWGYTRGGGKTWHGGADVEGLDDTTIRMPGYGLGAGRHAISGTVVTARRVAQSTGNPTWEWGWYVCVKLGANQTPDAVNYLYFCHNAKNLAAVGQRVKTGDALAVMGNTGNAALASPPYAHCHFEVRATATGRGLNPAQYMGFENAVGTFGTAPQRFAPFSSGECLVCARGSGPLSAGDQIYFQQHNADMYAQYGVLGLTLEKYQPPKENSGRVRITTGGSRLNVRTDAGTHAVQIAQVNDGEEYPFADKQNGWYFLLLAQGAGGWVSGEYAVEV